MHTSVEQTCHFLFAFVLAFVLIPMKAFVVVLISAFRL